MKLSDYIEWKKLTHTEVAEANGVSVSTITRAADGTTIPSRELMDKLYAYTEGMVTPNDYFGVGAVPSPESPGTAATEAA